MAWVRCCGGTAKDKYIVKDNISLYPFSGGATQTANGVYVEHDTGVQNYLIYTNQIDLTNANVLLVEGTWTQGISAAYAQVLIDGVSAGIVYYNGSTFVLNADVSQYTGMNHTITIRGWSSTCRFYVNNAKLI